MNNKKTLEDRINEIMWINQTYREAAYGSEIQKAGYNAVLASGLESIEIIQELLAKLQIAEKRIRKSGHHSNCKHNSEYPRPICDCGFIEALVAISLKG